MTGQLAIFKFILTMRGEKNEIHRVLIIIITLQDCLVH